MVESFPLLPLLVTATPSTLVNVCMGIELHLMMRSWEVMKVQLGML